MIVLSNKDIYFAFMSPCFFGEWVYSKLSPVGGDTNRGVRRGRCLPTGRQVFTAHMKQSDATIWNAPLANAETVFS
jgi:hypothetical protein